jgi:DNA-binding response OmpR family regulator
MKNTILIVDDEPDVVNLIEKFLRLKGFDTITSTKAKKAMKIIEESYDKIDLILLNIMMPGRGGYDVLQEVKKFKKFKDIPVVLITKEPISLNELLDRIKETLRKEEEGEEEN